MRAADFAFGVGAVPAEAVIVARGEGGLGRDVVGFEGFDEFLGSARWDAAVVRFVEGVGSRPLGVDEVIEGEGRRKGIGVFFTEQEGARAVVGKRTSEMDNRVDEDGEVGLGGGV